jgi:hypothetical protein
MSLQTLIPLLITILWLWLSPIAIAADTPLLTLEELQTRVKSPIPSESSSLIDLRKLTIDLRPENQPFIDSFYTQLQTALQKSGNPLGLDLSNSTIQGSLNFARLGLQTTAQSSLTPAEQDQLNRDRRRNARLSTLSQSLLITPSSKLLQQSTILRGALRLNNTEFLGTTDFTNTFFLGRLDATNAKFNQTSDWSQTRFSTIANFSGSTFAQSAKFRSTIFFKKAQFNQVNFQTTTFQNSEFQTSATFSQTQFSNDANFSRTKWQGNADFAQTHWTSPVLFTKAKFNQSLFLTNAVFDQAVLFRETQFNKLVNLRGATIQGRADFSYSQFTNGAKLNVPGLHFDSDNAKLIGDPGRIGQVITVPTIQGNETLIRELIRNFRKLEQISDANQIDYTAQKLRSRELLRRAIGINLNTATVQKLQSLGLSTSQANAILKRRETQPLQTLSELLSLGEIDLSTYTRVRDRVITTEPLPLPIEILNRIGLSIRWVGTSAVLVLSRNGTSFWLVFGVGLVSVAYFAILFWLIDRARRRFPQPILPTLTETLSVLSLATLIGSLGMVAIFENADRPWSTLAWTALTLIPIPGAIVLQLYRVGRYHQNLNLSYFVEEGTLRQLRLLIGRLPIVPLYPTFRERYLPIPWHRHWNWLNYFDFSFNNFLRFGFNDIRIRDEYLPGLFTTLVWYQWSLGTLYIALLLWTLSRTIPGLNLLIYFR